MSVWIISQTFKIRVKKSLENIRILFLATPDIGSACWEYIFGILFAVHQCHDGSEMISWNIFSGSNGRRVSLNFNGLKLFKLMGFREHKNVSSVGENIVMFSNKEK